MKRSEAIETVREYYPSSGKDLNEALETLIPELKESEDERIRKQLLDFVKDAKQSLELQERDNNKWQIEQLEMYISWIEKQGEQNPKSADFIPTNCTSDAKNENRWHKVEDSLPDNAKEVLCKDAIGNFFIGRYYNDGDYWEVSMYDEPDKSNKDNPPVIMWMNIPSYEQVLANSAKTCKVEQNPAWSEEDEGIVSRITVDLENCESEWGSKKEEEKEWLKSLKERYTWKPSDEQMEALDDFIYAKYPNIERHEAAVKSLYQDLKKLKG